MVLSGREHDSLCESSAADHGSARHSPTGWRSIIRRRRRLRARSTSRPIPRRFGRSSRPSTNGPAGTRMSSPRGSKARRRQARSSGGRRAELPGLHAASRGAPTRDRVDGQDPGHQSGSCVPLRAEGRRDARSVRGVVARIDPSLFKGYSRKTLDRGIRSILALLKSEAERRTSA